MRSWYGVCHLMCIIIMLDTYSVGEILQRVDSIIGRYLYMAKVDF